MAFFINWTQAFHSPGSGQPPVTQQPPAYGAPGPGYGGPPPGPGYGGPPGPGYPPPGPGYGAPPGPGGPGYPDLGAAPGYGAPGAPGYAPPAPGYGGQPGPGYGGPQMQQPPYGAPPQNMGAQGGYAPAPAQVWREERFVGFDNS